MLFSKLASFSNRHVRFFKVNKNFETVFGKISRKPKKKDPKTSSWTGWDGKKPMETPMHKCFSRVILIFAYFSFSGVGKLI